LNRRGVALSTVYIAGSGVFLAFQLLVTIGITRGALLLWAGYGFFATAGSVSYAILPNRFPTALAGRANTALNAMVFSWAFAVQWGMGAIIGLWPATADGYDPHGYRAGFAVFLAIQVSAWTWMVFEARRSARERRHSQAN